MTTPAVRGLAAKYPLAHLVYVTKKEYAPLLSANPHIDRVIGYEGSLFVLWWQLIKLRPWLIVDLHQSLRSNLLRSMIWCKQIGTYKGSKEREAMVQSRQEIEPNQFKPLKSLLHMADRHWQAIKKLGIEPDSEGLDYTVLPADIVPQSIVPFIDGFDFDVVAIGGSHATKRLPNHKLVALLRTIQKPVVLLGGPADEENGAQIAGTLALEGRWNIVNACGKLNLGQSGYVLSKCHHVWSHDTGMMHMAAALHKPLTTIWGSTVPQFGMTPYKVPYQIMQVEGLSCRPCHKHGLAVCPLGHFRCMEDLEIADTE